MASRVRISSSTARSAIADQVLHPFMLDSELLALSEVVPGEVAGLAQDGAGGQQTNVEIAIGHETLPGRGFEVGRNG